VLNVLFGAFVDSKFIVRLDKAKSDRDLYSLLQTKENVVLYVAHDNPGAAKVYRRVGFVGLAKDGPAVEGVDPWLEIGFEPSQVQLGHW